MTDKQKLITLLTEFGVKLRLGYAEETDVVVKQSWNGDNPKIEGYAGMYTQFRFDDNGQFISVGAWE